MTRFILFSGIQNRPSYAFYALWVDNTDAPLNHALRFSRVNINDHNVYDRNTGEFKTPAEGMYMFTANVCVYLTKSLSLQFLADGAVIGTFKPGDKVWNSCSSSTAMSQLLKGQIVKLNIKSKYGSGEIVFNHEEFYLSSFSGMLIK